jgi:glycosyltransferase involved in cell wall biosynthesis
MEPLVTPFSGNSFYDALRNIGRRAAAERSCRKASRVIAVSSFVRDFLVLNWDIPDSKIGIVPHGVEPRFIESQLSRPAASFEKLLGPWFFTAGSIRPARGLEDAIDALENLRDSGIPGTLVIAGAVSDRSKRHLRSLTSRIATKSLQDRVVWTGDLSTTEMAWCFSHCTGFLMTSRIEACPNTVLEALNYGAPSISTTEPPMPDFFRANALYYQAGDSEQLANRMREVLTLNSQNRRQQSERSEARARDFSWDATVTATVHQLSLAAKDHEQGDSQSRVRYESKRAS